MMYMPSWNSLIILQSHLVGVCHCTEVTAASESDLLGKRNDNIIVPCF